MKDDGRSKWEGDKSWPSHFLSDAHNTKGHTLLYQGRGTNSIDKVSICLNKERIYACSLFNDNVKVINMSIVQPHVTAEFTQVSFYHQGPSPVRKPSHHLSFKRLVEVINLCFFLKWGMIQIPIAETILISFSFLHPYKSKEFSKSDCHRRRQRCHQ